MIKEPSQPQNNSEVNEKEPLDPEKLWLSIEGQIKKELEDNFISEKMKRRSLELEEIEEVKETLIGREKVFFVRILTAAMAAAKNEAGAIALFDIDETIGVADHTPDNQMTTKLRPSTIPLFNQLKLMGLEMGFLSSRGKEAMLDQLQDETNLASVSEYINPDLVYSSRNYRSIDSESFAKQVQMNLGGTNGIVSDNIWQNLEERARPTYSGDQQKLSIIKEIRNQFPDKSIVVADDAQYPKVLSQEHGLYGICLGENAGAFYRP